MTNHEPQSVLIVGPRFFGYEVQIADAFTRAGWRARFVDERANNGALAKAIQRVLPSLTEKIFKDRFSRIARSLESERISLLLIIKGENIPRWFIEKLQRDHDGMRTIFYAYDSITESSRFASISSLFDESYSFDFDDVERYNDLRLKELFYAPAFVQAPGVEKDYDLSFLGTLHSDRYRFATNYLSGVAKPYLFLYSQALWFFLYSKLRNRGLRKVRIKEVSFRPLSMSETADVFSRSRAVLDMQRPGQSGMTMRSFEAVASGAVLVTSNASAFKSALWFTGRIVVVDALPSSELRSQLLQEVSQKTRESFDVRTVEQHSVDNWIRGFFPEREAANER